MRQLMIPPFKTITFGIILMICSWQSIADLKDETIIFSGIPFPPFVARGENSQLIGTHINLSKKVFEHLGLSLEILEIPYARALDMIKKGEIGIVQCIDDRIDGKSPNYYFPAFSVPLTTSAYSTNPDVTLSKHFDSFLGKSVLIVKDWPIGPYSEIINEQNPSMKVESIPAPSSAVRMIYGNRADILVIFDIPFDMITKQYNLQSEQLRKVVLFDNYGSTFCIPKTYPYAVELSEALKRGFAELTERGIIDKEQLILVGDNPQKYLK